jgi:hypothetical protein
MAHIIDYFVNWVDGDGEHKLTFPTLEKAVAAAQALVAYTPIKKGERKLVISERWQRFDRIEAYILGAIGIKNNGQRFNTIKEAQFNYAKNAYIAAYNLANR